MSSSTGLRRAHLLLLISPPETLWSIWLTGKEVKYIGKVSCVLIYGPVSRYLSLCGEDGIIRWPWPTDFLLGGGGEPHVFCPPELPFASIDSPKADPHSNIKFSLGDLL